MSSAVAVPVVEGHRTSCCSVAVEVAQISYWFAVVEVARIDWSMSAAAEVDRRDLCWVAGIERSVQRDLCLGADSG